jgi:hypothetical protein
MHKTRSRSVARRVLIDALENRQLLSGVGTVTTLSVPSSTLIGQSFTVTVNVEDTTGAAVTSGTVSLLNNDTATGLMAPLNANGQAFFNFGAGNAIYAGTYSLGAQYLGTSADAGSTSADSGLSISLPSFTTTGDGLQEATVTSGSGPGAVTGQSMTMLYTGFYQSNGAAFDESLAHSPGTFTFKLNASPEQVISGFDEGATGIEVGETRVLVIPSNLGYNDGNVRIFIIQSVASGSRPFGSAAQLNVGGQPSTATSGAAITTPIKVDVFDGNDNLVQTDASNVTLSIASGPAGATLGGTTTIAAQNGVATFSDLTFSQSGTYTLTASDGALSSETLTPVTVAAAPPVASTLVPTLGKVSLPSTAVVGGKLAARVPVVVSNQGSDLKGKVTVDLFADTGTTLDGNQELVTSQTQTLSLKAGKTHPFTLNVRSLPATLPVGTYYLLAEVTDPSGDTNVVATTQTVQVAAPFVQPAATVLSVPPHAIAPNRFGSVSVSITNDGNVASSALTATLSPSSDGNTPVPGVTLDTLQVRAVIQPGKKRIFILRFKVPSTMAAGTYFPYVLISLDGVTTTAIGGSTFTVS